MASFPIWPSSLPQMPLIEGYSEVMPTNLIRSNTDTGPAKVRKRGNAKPVVVKASYLLSTQEVEILDEFVEEQLSGGAICFDWVRPRFSTNTSNYVRARLMPNNDGLYTKSIVSNTTDFWQVELAFEIFPNVPVLSGV